MKATDAEAASGDDEDRRNAARSGAGSLRGHDVAVVKGGGRVADGYDFLQRCAGSS